jgi:hypothetical protein
MITFSSIFANFQRKQIDAFLENQCSDQYFIEIIRICSKNSYLSPFFGEIIFKNHNILVGTYFMAKARTRDVQNFNSCEKFVSKIQKKKKIEHSITRIVCLLPFLAGQSFTKKFFQKNIIPCFRSVVTFC